ncbi:MAG TPA: glutaminyl-peptide cyclotransferase, partial [Pseudonocardiaceae bacterium]|nr:glutaminyl-peptide cyclotransferase [Pseudonocardiaceae bacterium]
MPRVPIYALLAALVLLVSGCSTEPSTAQALRVQVLETYPHDPRMYTQGLEITGGVLYEGSGRVGQSR